MKNLAIFFSIFFLGFFISAEQLYPGLDEQQLKRLNYLSDNIRCPKCSYGNISSSNAPISKDLKEEIAQMILANKTNDEIYDTMTERYGDYILLNDPEKRNPLIFLAPLIVLIISISVVTIYTIKKSK
ncbi:MAG: cytochrome c-type biogenesis protein CcmH [SAR86 cluster bacterium]|uniref:Cytochrome c-type biogenesis protein n=1 Tax=SAR86 cluster bacterium TaxID=2030880 RepID=A0A937I8L2_9GAMM|nr:cytochrome c-type biogenesis protein CcmH [SAR86 cluster bacterium]MBL6820020.1 cytochrome c-type biogenesis protein CcmH [SAR86 cluster bacterium]MDA0900149.1 cytochrome c-type biogenesis protein CcmH [Pseudomonadota bacterium]MDA1056590.1 cytochrome c-type biogenesis protein CcmH [Pseudomonadota bacterium]